MQMQMQMQRGARPASRTRPPEAVALHIQVAQRSHRLQPLHAAQAIVPQAERAQRGQPTQAAQHLNPIPARGRRGRGGGECEGGLSRVWGAGASRAGAVPRRELSCTSGPSSAPASTSVCLVALQWDRCYPSTTCLPRLASEPTMTEHPKQGAALSSPADGPAALLALRTHLQPC